MRREMLRPLAALVLLAALVGAWLGYGSPEMWLALFDRALGCW